MIVFIALTQISTVKGVNYVFLFRQCLRYYLTVHTTCAALLPCWAFAQAVLLSEILYPSAFVWPASVSSVLHLGWVADSPGLQRPPVCTLSWYLLCGGAILYHL